MASMGGRVGFAFSSRSWALDGGRESSWDEWEGAEREDESGLFCWVRREESLVGRAKDCSNGLGSRSKLLRLGFGGGRVWEADCWPCCGSRAGGGDESFLCGMTLSLEEALCGLLARAGEAMTFAC